MQAALYDMYETLYFVDTTTGRDPTQSMSACIQILDTVTRGSELHVYFTCKMLAYVAAAQGTEAVQSQAAAQLCELGHTARYGHVSDEQLFVKLVNANTSISEDFL